LYSAFGADSVLAVLNELRERYAHTSIHLEFEVEWVIEGLKLRSEGDGLVADVERFTSLYANILLTWNAAKQPHGFKKLGGGGGLHGLRKRQKNLISKVFSLACAVSLHRSVS
jgi:hypothetical protein